MDELVYYILLSTVENIGYVSYNKIIETNNKLNLRIEDFFDLNEDDIRETYPFLPLGVVNEISLKKNNIDKVAKLYEKLLKKNVKILTSLDRSYPKSLIDTAKYNSPPLLYCIGNTDILNNKSIAIVGSREASKVGLELSYEISRGLSQEGYTIVSGFARGIDEEAHFGALSVSGYTILVLSYGILKFTSYQQDKLLKNYPDCFGNFVAISEYYPESHWQDNSKLSRNKAFGFNRNRTICGIAECTILVEGRNNSGSENSANITLSYKKPLFVVEYENYSEVNSANKTFLSKNNVIPIKFNIIDNKKIPDLSEIIKYMNK